MSIQIKALLAGLCGSVALSACMSIENTPTNYPVADTQYGDVEGYIEDGVMVFKGIRYGADTFETRFQPPKEPSPWSQPQEAKAYGASCPQTPTGNPGGLFSSWKPVPDPGISEDCLFLNVWTSSLDDGARRPVMLWYHGGGFSSGNGSSNGYDGVRLVNRGEVVVVTVNHRLNAPGYLYLAEYGDEFADSGNAGALDMVLALDWVRENIDDFGGDPDNILIFGESGGGAKVTTLLSMPAADGKVHRAVVQSGPWLNFIPKARAAEAARKTVEELGLTKDTIDQIKTMPIDQIRAAASKSGAAGGPVLDGRSILANAFAAGTQSPGADVPMMIGWNRTENTLFGGAQSPALFDLSWEDLPGELKKAMPDADVAKIIATYKSEQPQSNAADIYFEATSDARFGIGSVRQAQRKVKQGGAPTYLYHFNWDTPVDGGKWRSPHALEIGMVFDNVAKSVSMSGEGAEQQRIADIMAETWISFARDGNPDNPLIPHWQPFDLKDRSLMVLDETPELVEDGRGPIMRLFAE